MVMVLQQVRFLPLSLSLSLSLSLDLSLDLSRSIPEFISTNIHPVSRYVCMYIAFKRTLFFLLSFDRMLILLNDTEQMLDDEFLH